MQYDTVHQVYFSATNTTKTVVETAASHLPGTKITHDLLRNAVTAPVTLPGNSLAVVGIPVYGGRVPPLVMQSIANLRGQNTPAIAVAVYGNREYEDALLELVQTLSANGFVVIGAAAFIAQHSIFPQVATGRPDAADLDRIAEFATACARKLEALPSLASVPSVTVKGNTPYRELSAGGLKPSIDESCTLCGECVDVCPAKALRIDGNTLARDNASCIACAACIVTCPMGAQAFRGPQYDAFGEKFAANFSARKEPEVFV